MRPRSTAICFSFRSLYLRRKQAALVFSCRPFHSNGLFNYSIVIFLWPCYFSRTKLISFFFSRRCSTRARARARLWRSVRVRMRLSAQMEPPWARAPGIESHGRGVEMKGSQRGEKGSFEFAASPYRQRRDWQRCCYAAPLTGAAPLHRFYKASKSCDERKNLASPPSSLINSDHQCC